MPMENLNFGMKCKDILKPSFKNKNIFWSELKKLLICILKLSTPLSLFFPPAFWLDEIYPIYYPPFINLSITPTYFFGRDCYQSKI